MYHAGAILYPANSFIFYTWFYLFTAAFEIYLFSFCGVNLHVHTAYFYCENHLSIAHSLYRKSRSEREKLMFSLFLACTLWHVCTLDSVYSCSLPLCLLLSHIHIFSCDSFFQFSLVLLLPSLSPYLFSPFFLLYPSLSTAPLLSPSERLRIPKGADAIKMLILSVYRERERGGLTAWGIAAHMENSTEMENRGGEALGEVEGEGVGSEREGEGMCVGETEKRGMLAREKTDKDKACALSWAMI